jgi:putative cell wall-binding protein
MLVRRFSRLPLAILALVAAVLGSGLAVAVGAHIAHATTGYSGAYFDSEQNEFVGQGQSWVLPTVTYNGLHFGYPQFTASNGTDSFVIQISAPAGQLLVPGTYESAQRSVVRAAGYPGLDVYGDGRGCNVVAARFVIDDATYDASGNVLTFSARFEQHCEGLATALFGEFSYNSAVPIDSRTVSANALQFTSAGGQPITRSVILTNNGPTTDDPTQFALTGPDASQYSLTSNTCTSPLAANASCSATVQFTPLSTSETAHAQLSFTDELAPLGSTGEPAGAGTGRFINLTGIAGSGSNRGSITGTVTDSSGAPLAGVCVLFVDPATGTLTGPEATTASDGTYSTGNLLPWTYHVYFLDQCQSTSLANFTPVIYNNASTLATATPVTVVVGPVGGVNAQLAVGGQISGQVTNASGSPVEGADVTAFPMGDVPSVSTTTQTDANGDYTLLGFATGSYAVEFNDCPPLIGCQTQWYDQATSAVSSTPVNVVAGQAATTCIDATLTGIVTSPPTSGGTTGGGGCGANGAGNGQSGTSGGGGQSSGGGGGSSSNIASATAIATHRIFGSDAIATSIATSNAEFAAAGSTPAVVLARSDKFADALAGGPLAASVAGPLLITPGAAISAQLDPRVLAEISRVLVPGGTVDVLGGTGALSPAVDTALEARGFKVQRVFGADEYSTAVAIAHQLGDPTTVFEATGHSFADALSAVPAAIKAHGAILLTNGNMQAPATAAYLAAHPSDTRYAIGGSMAAAGADPTATAVFGADLYGTSAAVATKFFPAATSFAVATGLKFPDALSGGVMEGANAGPMLLVPKTGALPSAITSYLQSQATTLTSALIFGGSAAVSDAVVGELTTAG